MAFAAETGSDGRTAGKTYDVNELVRIAMRDGIFYNMSGGGVTITGGEPLAQDMGYLVTFLRLLKQNGVDVACDTCGDVPWENFQAVLPYINVFLYDMKTASAELHREFTGKGNERILDNLKKLGRVAKVWLRVPVIGGVNDGAEMAAMIDTAMTHAPSVTGGAAREAATRMVSLLPYHATGTGKWAEFGKKPPCDGFYTPSPERMLEIKTDWEKAGFIVD